MSEKVKNQHYVPRMYMKRFSQDQKRICVWNLMNYSILSHQRLENYAAIRYFYDADETELKQALEEMEKLYPQVISAIDIEDEQFVEKCLSHMEADVSNVLDLICSNPEVLYDKTNMQKLIIFLHNLAYRSEKYRQQIDNIRKQTLLNFEKLSITTEQVYGMNKTGKDDQLYQLVGVVPLLNTAKMLVNNYNWYIGIVSGTMKLVISDNPAQGIMLGFNDICFPLSGELAIIFRIKNTEAPIISRDMPNKNKIELSERSVLAYNAVQLSNANRFMFGDEASLEFLKMMSERQGGYANMYGKNK